MVVNQCAIEPMYTNGVLLSKKKVNMCGLWSYVGKFLVIISVNYHGCTTMHVTNAPGC